LCVGRGNYKLYAYLIQPKFADNATPLKYSVAVGGNNETLI